jgi:hypothetical protein
VKRNEIILVLAWLVVGAALVLAFSFYPRLNLLPGFVCFAVAIFSIGHRLRRAKRERENRVLVFGRLSSGTLAAVLFALFTLGLLWPIAAIRLVPRSSDSAVIVPAVVPELVLAGLAGVLTGAWVYFVLKRR